VIDRAGPADLGMLAHCCAMASTLGCVIGVTGRLPWAPPSSSTASADLVRQLSWPLPLRVICELIGLPLADAEQVRAWTDDLARLTSFGAAAAEQLAAAHGSVAFERYLAHQIDQRRHIGGDDLLTALLTDDADGADGPEPLTTDEVISLLMTLVFAGHETTANLIGNAFLLLLHRPERWAAAASDPQLVDAVVEETLRVDAPVQGMFRIAVDDTELAGVTIPAGAQVLASAVTTEVRRLGHRPPTENRAVRQRVPPLSRGAWPCTADKKEKEPAPLYFNV
jgi:cytochrome P450